MTDFLRSSRLCLALLLCLAVFAGVGTFSGAGAPSAPGSGPTESVLRFVGIRQTFSSPFFLALVAALVVNIVLCTVHRVRHGRSRRLYRILDLAMHAAILVLVLGAVLRVVIGSIGTLSVAEGQEAREIYDWGSGSHVPLEHPLGVEKVAMEHYPMVIRVGVRDVASEDRIALLEVLEGTEKGAPEAGVAVRFLGVDRAEGRVGCLVMTPAGEGRIRLDLKSGPGASADYGGYRFTMVAYRDEVKMVRALLATRLKDGTVFRQWLAPNERVRIGGQRISLTAWRTDPFGKRFVGLQVTSDPAAPVFWGGCVLFLAALTWRGVLKFRGRV